MSFRAAVHYQNRDTPLWFDYHFATLAEASDFATVRASQWILKVPLEITLIGVGADKGVGMSEKPDK